jgi:putative effector of murein hydrolase
MVQYSIATGILLAFTLAMIFQYMQSASIKAQNNFQKQILSRIVTLKAVDVSDKIIGTFKGESIYEFVKWKNPTKKYSL